MIEYLVFAGATLLIGLAGWWSWDEISLWYDHEQRELELDRLWADDDDLADSA